MISDKNDYWHGSGDAEYQMAVDKWANSEFGDDWRLYYNVFYMEKLFDSHCEKRLKVSDVFPCGCNEIETQWCETCDMYTKICNCNPYGTCPCS